MDKQERTTSGKDKNGETNGEGKQGGSVECGETPEISSGTRYGGKWRTATQSDFPRYPYKKGEKKRQDSLSWRGITAATKNTKPA